MRFFLLLFMLPWWAYLAFAGGVFYLGEQTYQAQVQKEALRAKAFEAPAPAPVNLSHFSRGSDITDVGEVMVTGWFNKAYNYNLVESTNLIETGNKYMLVLFGEGDTRQSKVARAAMILSQRERDWLAENLVQFYVWEMNGSEQFQYQFNGFASSSNSIGSHVSDVFRKEGLTRSPEFIYLRPFFDGREVALAPQGVPSRMRLQTWLIAAGIVLFGLAKLFIQRRNLGFIGKRRKADPFAAGPIAGVQSSLYTPSKPLNTANRPSGFVAGNPEARMQQRRQPNAQELEAAFTSTSVPIVDPLADPNQRHADELPKIASMRQETRERQARKFGLGKVVLFVGIGLAVYNPELVGVFIPLMMIIGFWGAIFMGIQKSSLMFKDVFSQTGK